MKRQLIAEQWNSFAREVMPAGVGAVQRQEMRRAFYAGAQAVLFGVIAALAPDHEPTAADLQLMQDVSDELEAFGESVKAGRA